MSSEVTVKGVVVALVLMFDKCCIVEFSLMRATTNVLHSM